MISVVEILEATTGGTRRHLRDLVLGLDPARFRVRVIVSPLRDPTFVHEDLPVFRARGIEVVSVRMRRRPAPLADPVAAARIAACLRRWRPDVVHAHSAKAGFLGRLAARGCRVPRIVYSPHGFPFAMDAPAPLRALYRRLERIAGPWTDTCICVCEQERHAARSLGVYRPGQLVVIPNGVDPPTEPLREGGGPSPGGNAPPTPSAPTVGFVGRLCAQKGPDLLAAAAPQIARAVPGLRFRFIGDGPMRPRLRRMLQAAGAGVRWTLEPGVDDATARLRLREVDVLAMPSRWEGLPYVLLDALAAGRPVAAAAVGGIPEWITDESAGLLVPPGNPRALAAAVIRLLRDGALRARIARQAPSRIPAGGRRGMVQRIAAVYDGRSPAV